MQRYIIIVAGGSGTRMNSDVPKQFMLLAEKPILMHTIEKFHLTFPEINIIVVIANHLMDEWKQLCKKYNFTISHKLIAGGETRFHSVKNGLECVPENELVGIHDAARPLVSIGTIEGAFEIAEKSGNATPCISISESIRELNGNNNKSVDRNKFVIIQTPQCFHSTLIKNAFLQEYKSSFTDDASVFESIGEKINLVEGNKENIKITTPQDLVVAETLIKKFTK